MNAATKQLVDLLRSGELKQIKHVVRSVDPLFGESFCAVGVAMEAYRRSHDATWIYTGALASATGSLLHPKEVRAWFGLPVSFWRAIIQLNDDGKSFDFIADYIEAVHGPYVPEPIEEPIDEAVTTRELVLA